MRHLQVARGFLITLSVGWLSILLGAPTHAQVNAAAPSSDHLKIVLLGSGMGPRVDLRQFGASTLIEAGQVRLLFDCGRGATLRLAQVGVPIGTISRL